MTGIICTEKQAFRISCTVCTTSEINVKITAFTYRFLFHGNSLSLDANIY